MSALSVPPQQGFQAVQQITPTFTTVEVIEGTWKEKDALVDKIIKGGASTTKNISFADPGVDVTCDWIIASGTTPYKKGNTITSTETTPRTFLIMDCETSDFGGYPCKQTVKLLIRTSLTLTASS